MNRPIRDVTVLLMFGVVTVVGVIQPAYAEGDSPPTLSEFVASPSSMASDGGTVDLSIRVDDDQGVSAVGATVYTHDGGALGVALEPDSVDDRGAGTYGGSVTIPPNYTGEEVSHTVEVSARDTDGAEVLEIVGNIAVAGQPQFDQAPYVSDPAVTPSSLPSTGGDVTIAVTATDDRSISEVTAAIEAESVPMEGISSDRFQGTWTAPPNNSDSEVVHTITITAYDDIGQSAYLTATVTVAGEPVEATPPVLSEQVVSPSSMAYEGGPVDISLRVDDDQGVASVSVFVHTFADGTLEVPMAATDVDDDGVGTYEGSVQVPPNYTDGQVTHIVEASARDTTGAVTNETIGNISVDGQPQFDEPPIVTDPTVTPMSLPASGGDVTIAATATDAGGITEVVAGIGTESLPLEPTSSDRYEGTWTVPANSGVEDVTHEVTITAYDSIGQSSFVTTTVTVAGRTPPRSKLELSTRALRFGGVLVGEKQTREVVITNTGEVQSVTGTIALLSPPFRVVGSRGAPVTFDLAPGGSLTLTLKYAPAAARKHSQKLTIQRDDGRQPRLSVRVTGRGVE